MAIQKTLMLHATAIANPALPKTHTLDGLQELPQGGFFQKSPHLMSKLDANDQMEASYPAAAVP